MSQTFEQQVADYAAALHAFRAEYGLPGEWFAEPDHIAVKCADATDFDKTLAEWLPKAESLSYIHLNGRRLATAKLLGPIAVGEEGEVGWLEIMEPRPEKAGQDVVGVDHMEFMFADFDAVKALLAERGVSFTPQENPSHRWVSIDANGHELKLNDLPLAAVVPEEIAEGKAVILK